MKLSHLLFYKSDLPVSYLPRRKPNGPFFDNPELNRILDENYEEVRKNGFSKLVLPASLHHAPLDTVMSANARLVADELNRSGFGAYIIGGATRDFIRQDVVTDVDFTTEAYPDDLKKLFKDMCFHEIPGGQEFGYLVFGDEVIDVATMTNIPASFQDIPYMPPFDPTDLYSKSLLFDALQRDFTFNALYYDTKTGELIDWLGGLHDLRDGIISTTVPAKDALFTDPRILLRALRFKARFGFDLREDLETAIREYGPSLLPRISPPMITLNLPEFFSGGYAYSGTCVLLEYGLFGQLFPSVGDLASSASYQKYVKKTAYAADWIYDEGALALPLLTMAAFLWPAVLRDQRAGISDAADRIMQEQRNIMMMTDDEAEFFRETLLVDETFGDYDREMLLEKRLAIFDKPAFEDALDMLRLHFWVNQLRNRIGKD